MYTARVTGRCNIYNVKIQTNKIVLVATCPFQKLKGDSNIEAGSSYVHSCLFFSDDNILTKPKFQLFMLASGEKVFLSKKLDMNTTYFNFEFPAYCHFELLRCHMVAHIISYM